MARIDDKPAAIDPSFLQALSALGGGAAKAEGPAAKKDQARAEPFSGDKFADAADAKSVSSMARFEQLASARSQSESAVRELDPKKDDFELRLAQKYDQETMMVWQAVANVLTAMFAQMMSTLFAEVGGNAEPKPEPIRDTTPTAVGGNRAQTLSDSELFDANGPSADDVRQGELGDCYFLSALGGVATEDPNVIRDNIRPHVDPASGKEVPHQYDVRFYEKDDAGNTSARWVTVNDAMLRDGNGNELYAQTTDNDKDGKWEQWVSIYEKAYAVFSSENGNVDDGYDRVGQGGWGGEAYFAITGRDCNADDPTAMPKRDLEAILARTNPQDGDVVMLGTIGSNDSLLRADGLPGGHMYQVLGTSEGPNGETMVTLRNPWGSFEPGLTPDGNGGFVADARFDGKNDGIFSVPLSQVQRDFDLITYPERSELDMRDLRALVRS